jgi:nucleolar GTP-binding protein
MDVDDDTPKARYARSMSVHRLRSQSTNRRDDGVTNEAARTKADRMQKLSQKKMNRMARQGEGDRHQTASMAKWLVAGKRGNGSTRSR